MHIHGNSHVETVKREFRKEVGVDIEVYDASGEPASDDVQFSDLRENPPENSTWREDVHGKTKVGTLEKEFCENYHVNISILRPDGMEADNEATIHSVRRAYERSGQLPLLAEWLNEKIEETGISRHDLANKSNVSIATIDNILVGKTENPHSSTREKIEKAIGEKIPKETASDIEQNAAVPDVGPLVDIGDPFDVDDMDGVPGVYVLYDISERPVYVGQSKDIQHRIKQHKDKKWFINKFIDTASYIEVEDESLRHRIESILISFLKSNAVLNKKGVDR